MRWAEWIVRNRQGIMVVAILLLIPSVAGFLATDVIYDVTTYLPSDMPAKQAQSFMEEKFGQAATAYVLLPDMPLWQAGEVKESIAALPGVEGVQWLDDVSHVSVPVEFMPEAARDNFLTDGAAVMLVQFKEAATSMLTGQAVAGIREISKDSAVISGFPAVIYDLGEVFAVEKWYYILVAVVALLLVLSISSSSTLEPILLLLAVGFSVVYNMGSNVFLGSISFVTQSIAAVLQLAVSMDYGIFLIHSFAAAQKKHDAPEKAMVAAIQQTGMAISASALTTVAGFASIILMQFGLGRDLGTVMAKGVIFSALSVLIILPGLLLTFREAIERYQHRSWLPSFTRLSHWVVQKRSVLVLILLLLVVPAFLLQQKVGIFYSMTEGLSTAIRSVVDIEDFKQTFGVAELVQLVVPDQGLKTERQLVQELESIQGVKSVVSLSQMVDPHIPQEFLPPEATEPFRQDNYALATIQLSTEQGDPLTNEALEQIEQAAAALYPESHIAGEAPLTRDLMRITASDLRRVNIISGLAIAVIICLAFGSLSVPIILVLAIQFAIWANLGIAYLSGTSLYFVTYLVLGAIQMGATVDYAILLTSKYRDLLSDHASLKAMQLAVEQSTPSIITSAMALMGATFAVSMISKIRMAGQMCAMLGLGALISMLTIILVLPGLLLYLQPVLEKTSLRWPSSPPAYAREEKGN